MLVTMKLSLAYRLIVPVVVASGTLILVACDDGSNCIEVPAPTAADLHCNADEDCTTVWIGDVCSDSCDSICAVGPGNTAYKESEQSALASVLDGPAICECPALGYPQCVSNQCVLCTIGEDGGVQCPGGAPADGG
jgi:hypothetical protein